VKIASWNVNSIRARLERVLRWLETAAPDVVCLQEIKVATDAFPSEAFREAGWQTAVHGQRTYNGVAILAREPLEDVLVGLQDGEDDPQARLIAATVRGVRVLSAYVPNGAEVGSERWGYKLRWLERLRAALAARCDPSAPLAVCGDFNVAPDDRDVADVALFGEGVLCHPEARAAFQSLVEWGLVDTFRLRNPHDIAYSWWDYRQLAFPRNVGLRIDHVLATPPLVERCTEAGVEREQRKGKQPSDHAPVYAVFED
jgi:exodeoxyribonuclease-3